MIRVLVCDDQALARSGLQMILAGDPDLDVIGEATDGHQAVTLTRDLHPDVVLMDIRMPALDGIDATRHITADDTLSDIKVLMLTTFETDEYVFEALRAGASGFVLKDIDPTDLRQAIKVVAAGEALLSPSVTRRLIGEFAAQPRGRRSTPEPLTVLTNRERQVVTLVATGLSNTEIAARLFMSLATAKTHVSRALNKLNARDRAQLVVMAYETGLVSPPSPSPIQDRFHD